MDVLPATALCFHLFERNEQKQDLRDGSIADFSVPKNQHGFSDYLLPKP